MTARGIGRRVGAALIGTIATLGATPVHALATISFSLPNIVQLTGLTDVTFTDFAYAADATNTQSVCVWSNLVSRGYTVTATGTDGVFKLTDTASSATAAYTVRWAAGGGAQSGTALAVGQRSGVFVSGSTNRTCSTGTAPLSTLLITIPAASVQTMTGGRTYTGTLTLMIAPA